MLFLIGLAGAISRLHVIDKVLTSGKVVIFALLILLSLRDHLPVSIPFVKSESIQPDHFGPC